MPKEFILDRYFGSDFGGHSEYAVKIGWSREGDHVEMAVIAFEEGKPIEHGGEAEALHLPIPQYVQLDRIGINEMIRALRRARDAAYGKDA